MAVTAVKLTDCIPKGADATCINYASKRMSIKRQDIHSMEDFLLFLGNRVLLYSWPTWNLLHRLDWTGLNRNFGSLFFASGAVITRLRSFFL